MESVDCIIIGAGVVGLAVARKLAASGKEVLILEAENAIGTQTSARNSEVIHAGIYYPPSSLKAALCRPGRDALYSYCAARGVPFRRCGKLIVATDQGQISSLGEIHETGLVNGVADLKKLDQSQVREIAPALNATAALWSPSTGIVDSHQLMLSLLGDLERDGGVLALNSRVKSISLHEGALEVSVDDGAETTIKAPVVVNSAGLGATSVAGKTKGMPASAVPDVSYAKGSYFSYSGKVPFDCLVYPVPTPGGLGIHLTLDQAGQARFGPDVEWVDTIDYAVDQKSKGRFAESVQTYWPELQPARLHASYSGIRIKTFAKNENYHDFVISGPSDHGIPGLINLFGIESPGLTACLAIADFVGDKLGV